MTAGDVSPLLNAFEACAVVGSPCPMVDGFRVDMAPEPGAVKLLTAMAARNSNSLGADHRRILEAIEDHANPAAGLTAWPRIPVPPLH
jgi:hypothetical protein